MDFFKWALPLLDQGCLYWENLLKGKVRSVVFEKDIIPKKEDYGRKEILVQSSEHTNFGIHFTSFLS